MSAAADGSTAVRQDIPSLTGVRAYAAIWVMLLHFQFSVGVKLDLGKVINHGFWAVDIFFVLSGFILSHIYAHEFKQSGLKHYRSYLAARFARIYPLHMFTLALLAAYILLRVARNPAAGLPERFDLFHLLLNLGMIHAWGYASDLSWNFPSWSISCEWFAYVLLLPLLCRYLRKWPMALVFAVAVAMWSALYSLLAVEGQLIGEQAVSRWAIPRVTCEFVLGYALYRLFSLWRPSPILADVMAASGVGMIMFLSLGSILSEWWLAPAISLLIVGLGNPGRLGRAAFGNRVAVYWGERSYSIYMLHGVVQIAASVFVLNSPFVTRAWAWPLLAAQIAAVLVGSSLCYRWIELPARHRLRRILSGPPTVSGTACYPA